MSIRTKRILFALGCLIVWFGFVMTGGTAASVVISGLAGWFMSGLIYQFAEKVFPNECNESS